MKKNLVNNIAKLFAAALMSAWAYALFGQTFNIAATKKYVDDKFGSIVDSAITASVQTVEENVGGIITNYMDSHGIPQAVTNYQYEVISNYYTIETVTNYQIQVISNYTVDVISNHYIDTITVISNHYDYSTNYNTEVISNYYTISNYYHYYYTTEYHTDVISNYYHNSYYTNYNYEVDIITNALIITNLNLSYGDMVYSFSISSLQTIYDIVITNPTVSTSGSGANYTITISYPFIKLSGSTSLTLQSFQKLIKPNNNNQTTVNIVMRYMTSNYSAVDESFLPYPWSLPYDTLPLYYNSSGTPIWMIFLYSK